MTPESSARRKVLGVLLQPAMVGLVVTLLAAALTVNGQSHFTFRNGRRCFTTNLLKASAS